MPVYPLPQSPAAVAGDTDRAEIIALLRAETEAFHASDMDRWSECFVHSPDTCEVMQSPEFGFVTNRGWDKIRATIEQVFRDGPVCRTEHFTQDNHEIRLYGEVAWVIFEGTATSSDGTYRETSETRIVERTPEGWKIVYSAFALLRSDWDMVNHVAVDADGQILWAAPGARELLAVHPALTVSLGRLRGNSRDTDRVLRDALQRAAKVQGFFQQQRFAEETGGRFSVPLVLGEDDEGGVVVCTLSVRDGLIYLGMNDDSSLDRRLAVAQAVFGLSDMQLCIAGHIARGASLASTAQETGITINTARTHLQRIYEKTGVRSQTALVRLLLSVS